MEHQPPDHAAHVEAQRVARQRVTTAHYDHAWRRLSARHRRDHPICVDCVLIDDVPRLGDQCDHILPIDSHPHLRLDPANLATRCTYHHALKTAAENRRRV